VSGAFECGVCWLVYDPAVGDTVAQIAPGTPFEALPETWRCPHCDSAKEKFLRTTEPAAATADPRVVKLVADYEHIAETRMKGLPIVNPRIHVEAVDFGETPAGLIGALVTPWSINAVLFPLTGKAPVQGHERALPGGKFRFLPQTLDTAGFIEMCSLFSPLPQFEAHEAAVLAARAALAPMVTAPPPPPAEPEVKPEPPPAPTVSRRDLFRGFRR
jgi:[NiFe] hydrogenase assembly HybE family chaperone